MRKILKSIDLITKLKVILDKDEERTFLKVFFLDILMGIFQSISIVSIFAFINTVTEPASIYTNKYLSFFYEHLNFSNERGFLLAMGFTVLLLLVLGNLLSAYSTWLKTFFVWNVNCRITTKLLKKYLFSSYSYFLNKNTAELEKNIMSESDALAGNLLQSVLNIIESFIITLIILITLLLTDPLVTIISMGTLVSLYLLVYLRFSKFIKLTSRERIDENKSRYKTVVEALNGIKYTKVVGKENYFLDEYTLHAKRFTTLQAKNSIIGKAPKFLMEIIAFGGLVGVILYSLLTNGNIETMISLIALFSFAGYRLLPALQNIYDSYTIYRFNRPVLDKIAGDLEEKGVIEEKTSSFSEKERISLKNEVKLKDISFSYNDTNKFVLKDINLSIRKNSSIAFVGPTGSGKTTLVDILLGLLVPTKGTILVDDKEINMDNIRRWRRNIGYVPQDIYLCDDTIAKNIAFGFPADKIDMEQVKEVARMANISDFIENELADGYSTSVGERGIRLSGGQKQRIGIARALYHNPEILILDEATSSLDNLTEKEVLKAIEEVSKSKTIIMIAHRLTTVEKCDKIYLLENGCIEAEGSYNYLIKNNKKFMEMSKNINK